MQIWDLHGLEKLFDFEDSAQRVRVVNDSALTFKHLSWTFACSRLLLMFVSAGASVSCIC